MRVANWRIPEAFRGIMDDAIDAGKEIMDEVVMAAKSRCPVGHITREGRFASANVRFTPTRGSNKGKLVDFFTDKRWYGRSPGDLRRTIRRVTKTSRPGNIRVMAGNFKIYWAYMVEFGTMKSRPKPYLRPTFNQIKGNIVPRLEQKIKASKASKWMGRY